MLQITDFPLLSPGSGGANEKVAGHLIDDTQSARPSDGVLPLLNVHTNDVGDILQRSGYTVYAGPLTTTTNITGLFQYNKFDGSQYEIACGDNGTTKHIWDISNPGSPVDIIGSVSVTADKQYSFAKVADTLIMTTEATDTPMKWTGTGNVTVLGGTPPDGKYVEEFNNYAFIANTSANPERVYWSGLFDPETWVGLDFYRLNGACMGIRRSQDNLYMFTINSIFVAKYTGDSLTPFDFDQIDTTVGCGAPYTILNALGTVYWVGNDRHIYRMNGYKPERVSEIIPKTISEINANSIARATAIEHKDLNQIWFAFPRGVGSTNNFIIAYDYLNNQFYFYDGMNANVMGNFQDTDGKVMTYFGDRAGYVYLTDVGDTDNPEGVSTAIDAYKYTKMFNFGAPNRSKRVRKIRTTVNNYGGGSSTITVIGDFGASSGEVLTINHDSGGDTIGSFIIGNSLLTSINDLKSSNDTAATARYIQLKIAHNQNNVPYKMRDLVFMLQAYPGGER